LVGVAFVHDQGHQAGGAEAEGGDDDACFHVFTGRPRQ
jgi:hypothetical protein